ncbi:MAG TPA: hypothetical protein VFS00_06160 [Polyangiaceae bacterium]|nr:hypothetical protein [Polyangiaceae bacterium]
MLDQGRHAQPLPGQGVVGIDHEAVGQNVDDAQRKAALLALGRELVADLDALGLGELVALDLEHRRRIVGAEGVVGVEPRRAPLALDHALEHGLERRHELPVAVHVNHRFVGGGRLDELALGVM